MIFLTTGEKIRSLRKRFGMRQQELEDENITRAFISMIETGKRGLSKETAKLIAEKFNKKAFDKGVVLNIDEAYLLRTPAEDAEIYCLQKLDNMPTQDEIEVILGISKKFQLTKVEAEAYKILGDLYYESKDYVESFVNLMISLDLYKETEDKSSLALIYSRLGLCKLMQEEFKEANTFFLRAYHYAERNKDENQQKLSLYNLAKCSEMINEVSKALEYIEKYLLIYSCSLIQEDLVGANVLRAKYYFREGKRDIAFNILTELLACIEDGNVLKSMVYNHLGEFYKLEGNNSKSLEYFTKAEEIRMSKDKRALACTLIAKANIYLKQNNYEEALKLSNSALKFANEYNDFGNIISCYNLQIEAYKALLDFSSLKNAYIKLLELLRAEDKYKEEAIRLYNKLALLYLEQNDIEMCKKYLNMVS